MTDHRDIDSSATHHGEPGRVLDASLAESLDDAASAVKAGHCIVIPTDTVYGIGSDAFSSEAVQRLLDAKKRGDDMPPPVLIAEPGMLRALTSQPPAGAIAAAGAFWPGALTLIVEAQRTLQLKIGETGGTVAVRVPDHDLTRQLLRRTGPLAVSSANISGQPPALTIAQAQEQLGESVEVYLDGGTSPGGVASTIIDFVSDEHGIVVREGAISYDELVAVIPDLVPLAPAEAETGDEPESSGEAEASDEAAINADETVVIAQES